MVITTPCKRPLCQVFEKEEKARLKKEREDKFRIDKEEKARLKKEGEDRFRIEKEQKARLKKEMVEKCLIEDGEEVSYRGRKIQYRERELCLSGLQKDVQKSRQCENAHY